MLVPAANVAAVNTYLTRQGYGPCFDIPVVIGAVDELVEDTKQVATHYATRVVMTEAMRGIFERIVAKNGGTLHDPVEGVGDKQQFTRALADQGAKRGKEAHPYQATILIRNGADKDAIIARMALLWPDSDKRFFLSGLSATGSEPATHLVQVVNVDDRAIPLIKWVVDNRKFTEVLVSNRSGNGFGEWRTTFDKPLYQGAVVATRTAGRVWLRKDLTLDELLKTINLRLIP